jgi:hypothetical protein
MSKLLISVFVFMAFLQTSTFSYEEFVPNEENIQSLPKEIKYADGKYYIYKFSSSGDPTLIAVSGNLPIDMPENVNVKEILDICQHPDSLIKVTYLNNPRYYWKGIIPEQRINTDYFFCKYLAEESYFFPTENQCNHEREKGPMKKMWLLFIVIIAIVSAPVLVGMSLGLLKNEVVAFRLGTASIVSTWITTFLTLAFLVLQGLSDLYTIDSMFLALTIVVLFMATFMVRHNKNRLEKKMLTKKELAITMSGASVMATELLILSVSFFTAGFTKGMFAKLNLVAITFALAAVIISLLVGHFKLSHAKKQD